MNQIIGNRDGSTVTNINTFNEVLHVKLHTHYIKFYALKAYTQGDKYCKVLSATT